jgi:hypothetical protein
MAWDDDELRESVAELFAGSVISPQADGLSIRQRSQYTSQYNRSPSKSEDEMREYKRLKKREYEERDRTAAPTEDTKEAIRRRAFERKIMRQRMPDLRSGVTHHFTIIAKCPKLKCISGKVGNVNCSRCDGTGVREVDGYITPNVYEDGRLGEIFIRIGKVGNEEAVYEQWAVAVSTALQFGVPVDDYFRKFLATRFEPSGRTKNPKIRFCTSVLDYVARYILMKHGSPEAAKLAEVQS